jgi:hypothetical protein
MNQKKRIIAAFAIVTTGLSFLATVGSLTSGCELIVQLDRSLADGGAEDVVLGVCPICANVEDGGADAVARDATTDVGADVEAGAD